MPTSARSLVQVVESQAFVYHPPQGAIAAQAILVKPNLGYPVAPPATVSMAILGEVLRRLRQHNATAEILIVEGVCSSTPLSEIASRHGLYALLDDGMRLLNADDLPMIDYPNHSPHPIRFESMRAPAILDQVDCRISVSAFKRTQLKGEALISASLKNLYGLFPRAHYRARSPYSRGQLHRPSVPEVLQDVYGCIGHLFDGAVVDGTLRYVSPDWKPDRTRASVPFGRVIWGDDLIAVDRQACESSGERVPSYIKAIEPWQQQLQGC